MNMAATRVSVFSDDPFIQGGLRTLFDAAPSITFVDPDSGSPGSATLDVLLVDSRTDGVLEHFSGRDADYPRLIFLFVPSDLWAADALCIGARGIIRTGEPISDVVRAIAAVQEGKVWAPRHVVVDAWLGYSRRKVPNPQIARVERRLSARERQIVRCVAAGMSNRELADLLAIRPTTVKAHLTHVFEKLGVKRRAEVIAAYHGNRVAIPDDRRRDSIVPADEFGDVRSRSYQSRTTKV